MNGPAHCRAAMPALVAGFEAGKIDADEFDHTAHVRLAWEYLQSTSLTDTLQRFTAGLRRLTARLGVPGKYHETVTGFLLLLIAERCQASGGSDWTRFRAANPDLFGNVRGLLLRHYTPERLDSPLARRQFLLPDRPGLQGTVMR